MQANFDLSPEGWATLRRLLREGLDLPPANRLGWIDALPADTADFKPRLRALLAHAGGPAAPAPFQTLPKVETGAFAEAPPKDSFEPTRAPGQAIGPYRLLRALGEGGMATVWLAERTDMLQGRPIALKLPHRAWRHAGLAERMAREREILATLDHPNIARLYDAGVDNDGQPYLALEFVEGVRLDAYAAGHAMAVPARLRLFLQVLGAVAHAHARLVVHRDLKPSNILVGADGQAKLLDFGIARLLDDGAAPASAPAPELTQQGTRVLTPDYASPEQIGGQAIGTASDIYSLGVVLFELLAGSKPYVLQRDSRAALEEAILHRDSPLPSAVATGVERRRALRGDLDTIVAKALKKAPEQRYATVNAFAEDIERHLSNRAVLARPDSRWYRLRKFVVRNKLGVAAGAAVGLAVVGGAALALWQARVAVHEQQRAERVKAFITSVLVDTDPYAAQDGLATTVIELLHRARARLATELTGQPEVHAELLHTLGKSYAGRFALAEAETVLTQALEATQALPRGRKSDAEIAALELDLGQVKKGLSKTGESAALVQKVLGRLTNPADRQSDLYVEARVLQAGLALYRGDYAELRLAAQEAIRISAQLHGENNWRAAAGYVLLSKMRSTTDAERQEVLEASRKAYELLRRIDGQSGKPHPRVLDAQNGYGNALLWMGDYVQAERHIAQAHADGLALFGPRHLMVGHIGVRLGYIHLLQGRLADGVREVKDALDTLAAVDPSRGIASAVNHRMLGLGLLWMHKPAQAIAPIERSLAIVEKLQDPRAPVVFRADYAMALIESGRLQEANRLLPGLDEAGSALVPPERPLRAMARRDLLQGQAPSARALLLQALALSERDPRKPYLADISIDLAQAALDLDDPADAERRALAALSELERSTVMATPNQAAALTVLAQVQLEKGAAAQALQSLQRADAIWRDMALADRWAGQTAYWLAKSYRALGREGEARAAAARAARLLADSPHPVDARLIAQLRSR